MGMAEQVILSAFVAAFVAGLFLLGGYYYNRRLERIRDEEQTWQRVGMPVINAADELIARLFDIIVRRRELQLDGELERKQDEPFNPSKELSTIWRLMHFFAASTHLEQHVADERALSKIANLRFFANNKARIPLKGNLYAASFPLQTEGQQLIGSKVLSLAESREIRDVDFFQFVKSLEDDDDLYSSAEASRQLLNFELPSGKLDGQLLCVAQFCIYLIDLVQDLRPSSKWEEFRLYLVSLLRAFNQSATGKTSFLYCRGDLRGEDYLNTFNVLPGDRTRRLSLRMNPAKRRNQRVTSRSQSGFAREIMSSGVRRRLGSQDISLAWQDSPGDLQKQLDSLFS